MSVCFKSIDPESSKDSGQEEKQDRPKWGQPVKPAVQAERAKWEQDVKVENLGDLELEQTSSQMEGMFINHRFFFQVILVHFFFQYINLFEHFLLPFIPLIYYFVQF